MMRGIVPDRSRGRRVLWGALSLLALALLTVVTPIGLYKLGGSPLLHLDLSRIHHEIMMRGTYQPDLVVHWLGRAGLLVAWTAWAWITLCVLLELISRVTGRSSKRLPASRSVQSMVALLVGATLALSAMGRAEAMIGAIRTTPVHATGPPAGHVLTRAHQSPVDGLLPSRLRVIEDANLHDGVAPHEVVVTESTERLQPTAPSSGPVLSTLTPEWPGNPRREGSAFAHRVEGRETLWSIAALRLGSPLRWREIAQLNYGLPQLDGGSLTSEHGIRPGWTLVLPLATAEPPPATAVRIGDDFRELVGSGGSRLTPGAPDGPLHNGVGHGPLRSPVAPVLPVGAGIVGAGVVDLLDRMRKVQQRHRDDGEFIQLPGREQSVFEQRLRLSDGVEIAASVDAALRLFVQGWNTPALPVPVVLGVTFSTDILELTLGGDRESRHVPGPFTASADGHSVSVDRNVLARAVPQPADSRITTPPAPALVTAGHGSDGLIMVNLESLGTMTVAGDPAAREGVIRALALELATSLRKRWFDLIVVGFGSELERFDRVTSVPDPAAVVEGLYRRRASNAESLRSSRFESLAHARCHDGSDRWDPTVVICGPAASREDTTELLALASDARLGIAVVAAGEGADLSPTVVLTGRYGDSSRNLLGSVVLPQQITLSDLEGVTALMDNAVSRQSVPLSAEPYVNLSVPMPCTVPAPVVGGAAGPWAPSSRRSFRRAESTRGMSRQGEGPRLWSGSTPEGDVGDPEVEVLVLGQIDVRGAARPFTRAWAQELVVYLAMHPRGATTEAWATALWPERIMAPSSLHSTASVARRSLGQAADGVDHLPRGHGRLTLSSTVGTDWDRFVMLAESEDPTRWRGALGLIRGRPFEGLRSSDWPILEGIAPAIEAAAVDLSGRLARSYLAAGDSRGAEWAARQGLMVSPYDERLYRILMRAADVAGNLAGVEAVMAELVHLVADDIEPLESVHPRTMDLYRSLTRGRHGAIRPL